MSNPYVMCTVPWVRMRQQLGSVTEYIAQFTELIDQLAAYESPADPTHYTMRFIDGTRPELRSTVLLQRPPNLDTACSLAALQEEVSAPRREEKKSPFSSFSAPSKGLLHLPLPPASDKSKFMGDYKSAPKPSLLSS